MININKKLNLIKLVLVTIVDAGFFYFGTEYWLFSWFALTLASVYALKANLKRSFFVGSMAYFLGNSNPQNVLPIFVYGTWIFLNAIAFGGILLSFKMAADRWKCWKAIFVFATGITGYEYIISLLSPHGTVSSIAYTQTNNLIIIQIASLVGIWGITFIMTMVAANAAVLIEYKSCRNIKQNLLTSSIVMFAIIFGLYRLYMPVEEDYVKVGAGAVSSNLQQYLVVAENKDPQKVGELIQRYIEQIDDLAEAGADYVVLPEKIITITSESDLKKFYEAARRKNIYVIVGVSNRDGAGWKNTAYVVSNGGEKILQYDKHHLQTTFEKKYIEGNHIGVFENKGVEICKDMDFTWPSVEYSKQGVDAVFVPALDFHDDAWSHARVAIVRGVEGNFSVVRAAQWGLLSVSDNRGRVLSKLSTDAAADDAKILAQVPVAAGNSIYSKIGDIFAWVCIISFVSGCIELLKKYK